MTRVVYLHGFSSSPQSSKARYFAARLAECGVELEIPQLDEGDFEHTTITRQLRVVERTLGGAPARLIGSSLGGYLAALYAARHAGIERLVLLAPAFRFPRLWTERYSPAELAEWERRGLAPVFHYAYGEQRPLGYEFYRDSLAYEDEPEFTQPALIFHGTQDPVVPAALSESYAARHRNVRLHLLPSAHELTDVLEAIWSEAGPFLAGV
jgi:pimeloyl-ACP methyl ester carboxylesterase